MTEASNVSPMPLNAAQLQNTREQAIDLFRKWMEHTNMRKVAAELILTSPHVYADPLQAVRDLYAFLSETND